MKINSRIIAPGHPVYTIAELSHNHQGEASIALKLIEAAAAAGASAVKFQKRDNRNLFSQHFYNSPYSGPNSFGKTYGEHREFLEPKKDWLIASNQLAHSLGMDFIMTCFDTESIDFCESYLEIDAYKIQSSDLTHIPLIEKVIQAGKPYFISCGASSLAEIKRAFSFCQSSANEFCLMYAIASYPTATSQLNLSRITQLQRELQTHMIGYSCHYEGNDAALYARVLGALAIEKHFTLDHSWKGPDHRISSEPHEFAEMVRRIGEADLAMGKQWEGIASLENYQGDSRYKMGKCAIARTDIPKGHLLQATDLVYKSPAQGLSPMEVSRFFGKKISQPIAAGTPVLSSHFDV